jgi:hypothetical protein
LSLLLLVPFFQHFLAPQLAEARYIIINNYTSRISSKPISQYPNRC